MLATEVSIARMISAMRRMFVCVSVSRIELLLSFALIVAVSASNGRRFSTSFAASPKRSGRICVTISSLRGMRSGSLPVCTGRSRFCASLRLHDLQDAPVADGDVAFLDEHGIEQIDRLLRA